MTGLLTQQIKFYGNRRFSRAHPPVRLELDESISHCHSGVSLRHNTSFLSCSPVVLSTHCPPRSVFFRLVGRLFRIHLQLYSDFIRLWVLLICGRIEAVQLQKEGSACTLRVRTKRNRILIYKNEEVTRSRKLRLTTVGDPPR
jgi:hypothetical protein